MFPPSMSTQDGSRKRGRPAKYASKEESNLATAQRKRVKRQLKRSEQRAAAHDQFYVTNQTSAPPSPPSPPPALPIIQRNVDNARARVQGVSNGSSEPLHLAQGSVTEFDAISPYLPPPSPGINDDSDTAVELVPHQTTPPPSPLLAINDHVDNRVTHNRVSDNDVDTIVVAHRQAQPPTTAHDDDERTAKIGSLADQLVDQLTGFRGCCTECHDRAEAEHGEQFQQHTSLATYVDSTAHLYPDILGTGRIALREDDLPN